MNTDEEYKWVRIRTNNGEWISDIHIEILDEDDIAELEYLAHQKGKQLDKHYGYYETGEKLVWCYKTDIEELRPSELKEMPSGIFTEKFQDRLEELRVLQKQQGVRDYGENPHTLSDEEWKEEIARVKRMHEKFGEEILRESPDFDSEQEEREIRQWLSMMKLGEENEIEELNTQKTRNSLALKKLAEEIYREETDNE